MRKGHKSCSLLGVHLTQCKLVLNCCNQCTKGWVTVIALQWQSTCAGGCAPAAAAEAAVKGSTPGVGMPPECCLLAAVLLLTGVGSTPCTSPVAVLEEDAPAEPDLAAAAARANIHSFLACAVCAARCVLQLRMPWKLFSSSAVVLLQQSVNEELSNSDDIRVCKDTRQMFCHVKQVMRKCSRRNDAERNLQCT